MTTYVDEEPRCAIDPELPCRQCAAEGPWACPYPYLMAGDELYETRVHRARSSAPRDTRVTDAQ